MGRILLAMDLDAIRREREYLDRFKIPYKITISNYTVKIETAAQTKLFSTSAKSNVFFAAAAKVKADCKRFEPPKIEPQQIKYFYYNPLIKNENVNCVDITAAYPTALLNAGYITAETFSYLMKIDKLDRLGAIGMLASKKNIFEIVGGEILDAEFRVSELENFFWFCVAEINKTMFEIQALAKEQILLFWVDGIFFNDPDGSLSDAVVNYLKEKGFNSKKENITNFEIQQKNNVAEITYLKDGKPKILQLPLKSDRVREAVTQAVLRINAETTKNQKIKKTKT